MIPTAKVKRSNIPFMLLEVCVNSVESALAAERGGANRVELCDNINEGGTTPSLGMVSTVRKRISIGLNVLIRPRGGDFLYNSDEIEIIKTDILALKNIGVDGFVFGCLTSDGNVDIKLCSQLIEICYPQKTTFHRAYDMTENANKAFDDINRLGFDYLLTSGQKQTVYLGSELIANLIKKYDKSNCKIMPGGGVNEENITNIAQFTKAQAFHVSLRKTVKSKMKFRKNSVIMGKLTEKEEYEHYITDENRVKKIVEILKQIK